MTLASIRSGDGARPRARRASAACWEAFLGDLYKRGLKASPCQLIATDGGTGLHQALQIVYPKTLLQRCWAHKTRNVLDKVKKKDQPAVKKALTRISHAANRREAAQAYWRFSSRWRKAYPRAVACLKKDFDQLLSFFAILTLIYTDCAASAYAFLRSMDHANARILPFTNSRS